MKNNLARNHVKHIEANEKQFNSNRDTEYRVQ